MRSSTGATTINWFRFSLISFNAENLNGMHAQAGKRLNVSVAMVDRVDVLVQGTDVDEPGQASLCAYQL